MTPSSAALRPALLLALALAGAAPAAAQLRPLAPMDWRVLDDGSSLVARAGVGFLRGQRAALAGTEGSLTEVGDFDLVWRSDRIALELGGTLLRLFEDRSVYAEPYGGADPDAGPRRRDTGAFRVGTIVRLTPEGRAATAAIRFGTRLPTTDNEVGLDRDRTDFYALAGGSLRRGHLRAGAEAGIGIFGSHDLTYEQADVFLYALGAEYSHRLLSPSVALVGHRSGINGWVPRGNENLAELRVGARTGGRYSLGATWVRGLTDFSPSSGVLLSVQARR